MNRERSFVMVKPDGVKRGLTNEIIKRLKSAGLTITAKKEMSASQETIVQHYPIDNKDYVLTLGHRDITGMSEGEIRALYDKNKKIIKTIASYIRSGPIVAMIVEGPKGTIEKIREVVGKTNPAEAAPGTVRGDFGEDSYEASDKEQRAVRNIVHASGSPEEAEREIKIWFPELA